jgi:dienelactone hydrolase
MLRPLLPLLLVTLIACAPASAPVAFPATNPALANFAELGPYTPIVASGRLPASAPCTLTYEAWRPAAGPEVGVVVLAHGFLRDLRSMRGWAEHFASHGWLAIVASLCQSTPFDGRHAGNAADLRLLIETLAPTHPGPRVYAGFSAGGLAALLAAHADPHARAVLALDPVDSGGLLADLPPAPVAALVLFAEPSSCNAEGNAAAPLAAWPNAHIARIGGATHCHFEHPFARACEWVCGRVTPRAASDAIALDIRARATDYLRTLVDRAVSF